MKYRLGEVQPTNLSATDFGFGFNITNERGAPIVMFGYLDAPTAANARALIEQAIAHVVLIVPAG
jgi:hypothetical protein